MEKKYQEPAFPTQRDLKHQPTFEFENGMTLLDYFAAKVCSSICNGITHNAIMQKTTQENISKQSYGIAEAMMKEREKYLK